MHRASTTALAGLLVAIGLSLVAAPGPATATAAAPRVEERRAPLALPAITPRDAIAGERIVVSGSIPKRWRRSGSRALIQLHTGRRWKTVARTVINKKGRYRVPLTMPGTKRQLRLQLAGRKVSTGTVRLSPRRQEATLNAGSAARGAMLLSGTVAPARTGRKVTVQEQVAGRWLTRHTTRTDKRGRWTVAPTSASVRLHRWRATIGSHRGAPGLTTPTLEVLVRPLTGSVTTEITGEQVTVAVQTDQALDQVELFIDERSAGMAHSVDQRSWDALLDVAELPAGEHRVTARLVRGAERGLVTSAPFHLERALPVPPGYSQETLAAGLVNPTTFAMIGTDSALIAEKAGAIWLVTDGVRGEVPVIDLTDQVDDEHDRGLTGLALHPDFDHQRLTGWVYVAYVWDDPDIWTSPLAKSQRVTRVHLRRGVRDGAEQVILGNVSGRQCDRDNPGLPDCIPSWGTSHTIGDLLFHPDGSLFVSIGDGVIYWGEELENIRAQSLDVLAGKVLRIDPETGLGLPDNPFYDGAGTPGVRNRNRVYAYGLRNPFRMALDSNEALIVGEVGGSRWEEINRIRPGANLGWPCFEAADQIFTPPRVPRPGCPEMWQQVADGESDLDWPIFVYPHRRDMGSVTAGVTLGQNWPGGLAGRFLYADYVFGEIRTVDLDAPEPAATDALLFSGQLAGTPVKILADSQGRLWYLSIFPGELRRIEPGIDGVICGLDKVRAEWFHGTEPVGEPAAVSCSDAATLDDVPTELAGEPYTVRWRSRLRSASGPLEVAVQSDGWTQVQVNGRMVHDAWGPTPTDERIIEHVSAGVATVVVVHRVSDPYAEPVVAFSQPGGSPTVSITLPEGGAWVGVDEAFTWQVLAQDEEGRDLSGQVQLTVELMHHGEGDLHLHPALTRRGSSGELTLGAAHAPGLTAYRLSARVTDSQGRTGFSAPAYVCLRENQVGVCS
ncbi:PQQ-dependent sugar dehydrogenase [Nocardioides sp. Bht2]|uniref:PQQ-dependent sugar dehydrogenase n=1 Tax=Nocardioides sp. Bht2 TaxID=3392297 RepID=UPI0039B65BF4